MSLVLPFDGHTPAIDPSAWAAPNATLIGQVTLGATQAEGSIAGVWPSKGRTSDIPSG